MKKIINIFQAPEEKTIVPLKGKKHRSISSKRLKNQFKQQNPNLLYCLKMLSPYLIVFLFTIIWKYIFTSGKTRCLGVGMEIPDNCTPSIGSFWGSLGTSLIAIHVYSSGHFLFGSSLLSKYSDPKRKNRLIIINFIVFITSHFIVLNISWHESVCIFFKISFVVIVNAFSFMTISKFIGHPKAWSLMRNYFYFELLTSTIPAVSALGSNFTYYLCLSFTTNETALVLIFFFNTFLDILFSEIMREKILGENKFLEIFDLMPGIYILNGYLDGVYFGNILPQEINSLGFWANLIIYSADNIFSISGFKHKVIQIYHKWRKQEPHPEKKILLIQHGSRFYSIFPMIMTVFFVHIKAPYLYGSLLYNYENFDWLETSDIYNKRPLTEIFSFQKLGIMIGFWVLLVATGIYNKKHYAFEKLSLLMFVKNIFFTFKICTMFTIGFEIAVQVADVINKDVVDQVFGPYWRLFGIGR